MAIPETMNGVVLTGHGGLEKLVWRTDLPVPVPGKNEVLIRVGASSVNNTDVNTRTGWYSKAVRGDTASGAAGGYTDGSGAEGSWTGKPLTFPHIQGADCCGEVVAVGDGVPAERIGERVLVRALQSMETGGGDPAIWTFGSECAGGFAQYATARSHDALAVNSGLSDAELASFPCAFSTAEGMLQRGEVTAERVLITGASGGVGSAAIQLAKRRGAHVTAVTSPQKPAELQRLGADETLDRDAVPPEQSFDVVLDLVGGPSWGRLIDALGNRGRYVTSGAIAGPIVELDLRTLYLRDLTLIGSTYQPDSVFQDLVRYIEAGEIRPVIAKTYPLRELQAAQEKFLEKSFVGKIAIDVGA
ncbi:alcohol dehydrogenase family protein [Roseibium sp. FZY0029]|uniref:alcohol dehydrogenase family protein n=1 Tax=Roseibium sp. FZY0029 TaxID=3116647 RepID=UPI002E9F12E0|nr:alcohol dehydrogenase family protein [Roseibium sp. FZY0029]